MHLHFFKKRRVAVREPNVNLSGVVEMFVDGPRRSVPEIVLRIPDLLAIDHRASTALDAEVHERRIMANRLRPLPWIENAQCNADSVRESVAGASNGIADDGHAPPVRRPRP